jgi:hypothetical protein
MSKLPKSSRVDRRKPSKTFNHPYQLNIFDPPLASTLRNVGYIAKTLFPIYAGLIYGYMSSAQHLGDEPSLTVHLFSQSGMLTFILAIICCASIICVPNRCGRISGTFPEENYASCPAPLVPARWS